jgi:hypothetical protein
MVVEIEKRAYGPDSTPEEVEALKQRVKVHAPGIVVFKEVPVPSAFALELCMGQVAKLAREHGCSKFIVDLTEAARPPAELGELLKKLMREQEDVIKYMAVFTGKNFLLNIAAKFVLAGVPQRYSVHKTLEQAEEALAHADEG